MTTRTTSTDPNFIAACGFAQRLGEKFLHKLDLTDAASALIATGVLMLANGLGKAMAVSYLRDLASELEGDADSDTTIN